MEGPDSEVPFIFPAIFTDGLKETIIGDVVVFPSTLFQDLKLVLSQKIHIPPDEFSVFLSSPKRPDWIVHLNSKVDFSNICGQKDAVFLVALKRALRSARDGNLNQSQNQFLGNENEPAKNSSLMKKDENVGRGEVLEGYEGFERRVRNLQIEKERFLWSMGMADSKVEREREVLVCEECKRAKGMGTDVGFHHCVKDAVTFGLSSAAGPIARPAKSQSH